MRKLIAWEAAGKVRWAFQWNDATDRIDEIGMRQFDEIKASFPKAKITLVDDSLPGSRHEKIRAYAKALLLPHATREMV